MSALSDFDRDQYPRRCAGFSDEPGNALRLIVELGAGESVCDVFVEELADRVEVEVLACPDGAADGRPEARIYLRTARGGRPVVDLASGTVVPAGRH